ncbi:matrixin family metalloprotease [Streptomyces hydrogenans]|uniref:matrixin family metalloprotease n=1 Tax=Streptomyces hydrogenans TaxID=1873719 RepID=UPI0038120964
MRTNTLALAAASAAAVLLAVPAPASASRAAAQAYLCEEDGKRDSRGFSSVDGTELEWDDDSRFDDARKHVVKVWTAGSLKQVRIKPDGATSYADLEWKDTRQTANGRHLVYGRWDPNTGTDYVWFNRAYLDDGRKLGADVHRRRVAAHELGHALGFCHKPYNGLYPSLMWAEYSHFADKGINGPTEQTDIKAYHALWG